MTTITQTIDVYGGTVPNRSTQTQVQFDAATDSWLTWENTLPAQINTWATQANTIKSEINTDISTASTAATTATNAATSATASATAAANSATSATTSAAAASTAGAVAGAAAAGAPIYPTGSPYSIGEACVASNGYVYRSLIDNNTDNPTSGSANWLNVNNTIAYVNYDDRGDLRTAVYSSPYVLVEGLGLFRFDLNSTEPDDDESCFANATGRWLLECVHWDVVDAWQLPDDEVRDESNEDAETRLDSAETRYPGRILFGTATQSVTSIAATTQVNFTATISGAAVNNHVLITPPTELNARISVFARVTAANTITIYLNNPSASTASLTTGTWRIAVIQES